MLRSNLNTINARIFNKTAIRIDDQALREVEACYRFLEKFEQGKVIYGINTGFGPMAQYRIGHAEADYLHDQLWMQAHGIASMVATDFCVWDSGKIARMLADCKTCFTRKFEV